MIKRKKVCKSCGRKLWLKEFYVSSYCADGRDRICKTCRCKEKRDAYERTCKVPDGRKLNSRGQAVEKNGLSTRLYWSDTKKAEFRRAFPYKRNEDLAIEFGCSLRTIVRRAREMNLEKDHAWLANVWDKNRGKAHLMAKLTGPQNLPEFIEGGKATRFGKVYRIETKEQAHERVLKAWQTRRAKQGA